MAAAHTKGVRIVSLLPGATETLAFLGLQEALLRISADTAWPPEVLDRPVLNTVALGTRTLSSREIDAVAREMADLSAGRTSMPPRAVAVVQEPDRPPRGGLAAMPTYLPSAGVLAAKLVAVFPGNAQAGLPTHEALIAVFDATTGRPTALLDGTYITAARTAAGSALATRLLARADAAVLAILGTGAQARMHARLMLRERSWAEVRIAGRDATRAAALPAELSAELGVPIVARGSIREALKDADVACATTSAPEPEVRREWLLDGTHVNSVGFSQHGPEVDAATVAEALLVVESRAVALAPFPIGPHDLRGPLRDGIIGPDHIHAEIGELVLGRQVGRTSPRQITLYKSVGVAVQDAAAAALVLASA